MHVTIPGNLGLIDKRVRAFKNGSTEGKPRTPITRLSRNPDLSTKTPRKSPCVPFGAVVLPALTPRC
jgi:hypothetical protein